MTKMPWGVGTVKTRYIPTQTQTQVVLRHAPPPPSHRSSCAFWEFNAGLVHPSKTQHGRGLAALVASWLFLAHPGTVQALQPRN